MKASGKIVINTSLSATTPFLFGAHEASRTFQKSNFPEKEKKTEKKKTEKEKLKEKVRVMIAVQH